MKKHTAFLLKELQSHLEQTTALKRQCFDNDHYEAHVALSNVEPELREAIRLLEAAL
jgi:hypothetical protein